MRVRHPSFQIADLEPIWADNREFAHHVNATGIIPSAVEPFLIKVMRRAKAELDPSADAPLIADIDIFNRQEAQHYKAHEQFNQMVADKGYPELLDHDRRLKHDYDEFLASRSLDWLLGYCEGFESLAAAGAHVWVDNLWAEYLAGADRRVVELWRWHLAEEYEHRTVVHRLFHRLCPGTPDDVYAKRVELFEFTAKHLALHSTGLRSYLLDVDRASMNTAERRASETRVEAIDERMAENRAGIAAVLQPTWDPEGLAPPQLLDEVLVLYP